MNIIKTIILALFLNILILNNIHSLKINNFKLSNNFNKIITIDNKNQELIDTDINLIDFNKYFYFFCMVSEKMNNYDFYYKWFKDLNDKIDLELKQKYKQFDIENWNLKKQKEFCETVLILLYDNALKSYNLEANRISDIVEKGEYNCVNSSIIYSIFLKKYGFFTKAVQTKDHVFIKIIFNDSIEIDVETTNKYGFEPGNKKEILDQLGKTTGFTYIPQKNYSDRFDINLKSLLYIVYNNILEEYYRINDYIKYTNLGYIIYKGRNDKKSELDFEAIFNNYLLALSNHKKYIEAIEDINSYLFQIDDSNKMIYLRFALINNYVNDWNDYNQFIEVQNFLIYQNNLFENLKDNDKFVKSYLFFIFKITEYFNENKDFNKSYDIVSQTYNLNKNYKEAELLFNNIIINEIDYYDKNNDNISIKNKFNDLKTYYPEFINFIIDNEKIYFSNMIFKQIQKNNFLEAIKIGKNIIEIYPEDKNIILNYKSAYTGYTILLYKNRDINNMIKYCDEALLLFPDDTIIKNNYLSFFMNLINENINNKNYKEAKNILIIAKDRFNDNIDLNKKDDFLKSKD